MLNDSISGPDPKEMPCRSSTNLPMDSANGIGSRSFAEEEEGEDIFGSELKKTEKSTETQEKAATAHQRPLGFYPCSNCVLSRTRLSERELIGN